MTSLFGNIIRSALALAVPFLPTTKALAQCQYEVAPLEYPLNCGIGFVVTAGVGLNSHGAVVGRYQCSLWTHSEAFLWTPENGYVTLPRPAGVVSSQANDINDDGIIVGTYVVDGLGFRGFVYADGQYTELSPVPGGVFSWCYAINNEGKVVGDRSIRDGAVPYNAFVWSASDGFVDLGVMSGPSSYARGISDQGEVVGWTGNGAGSVAEAFLWDDGSLGLLGPIPGGFASLAFAVSENRVVVGSGRIPMKGAPFGAPRAFRWKNGQYTLLGTLPGHAWSRAHGVSPEGQQVVGRSWNVAGNPSIGHAFIWQNGVMTDLNELVDVDFGLSEARTVNASGQILATAGLLTPLGQPLGDLDHDCRVGIVDFLILLAAWGESNSPADLDGDGTVGLLDFWILIDNWS